MSVEASLGSMVDLQVAKIQGHGEVREGYQSTRALFSGSETEVLVGMSSTT